MSDTLIPWRSCSVEIYRYRQIGILWYSRHSSERHFVNTLDFVRRAGTGHDDAGFRHVYADGHQIDISEIDFSGLDEALAAVRARRAA